MTDHRQNTQTTEASTTVADEHAATIAWLESEFPEWRFEVGATRDPSGDHKPWWVARREGHHPQAELSPGKLSSRLADYQARQDQRTPADDN